MSIGDFAEQHGDKIEKGSDTGIEKAGDFVDDKTGGKGSEHIEKGEDFADDKIGDE